MSEEAWDALARRIHAAFKAKPESQHIATEFALIQLSRLVGQLKPRHILEVGAGIGTITRMLLDHPQRPARITASEAHPLCLRELEANLNGADVSGLRMIRDATELDVDQNFDLVVFDGSLDNERQYGVFREGTWCFVEGGRRKTIGALQEKLRQRGLALNYRVEQPAAHSVNFLSKRRIFGFRLPAYKIKPQKGCSIGQVVRAA